MQILCAAEMRPGNWWKESVFERGVAWIFVTILQTPHAEVRVVFPRALRKGAEETCYLENFCEMLLSQCKAGDRSFRASFAS